MQQQDWDDLKQQMASPYGYMKLKCDQFEVALSQEVDSKGRKWATSVYVDGVFKGAWCSADEKGEAKHEEGRRFLRKVTRRMHSAKKVEAYRKALESVRPTNLRQRSTPTTSHPGTASTA